MRRPVYENTWLSILANRRPDARAYVAEAPGQPEINGIVSFYQTSSGVLVVAEVYGLPYATGPCLGQIYGFHIHQGGRCTGNAQDPFADAQGHYNPEHCPHPQHAGDLPPLFGNNGCAWGAVLTNRFTVREVLGRTVVIHSQRDDFTSQPAGDSGVKLACGVIQRN